MFYYRVREDIHLKLLELRDAQDMFTLTDDNRTYLREWLPWVDGTATLNDTTAFIQSTLHQFASNRGFQAGILYNQQLVGALGLHDINWGNRSSSVGYWLAESFQGNGIMTEACKAVVNLAFREYGLNRVEIRAAVANHKSRAIPERLGFHQEGICRQAEWLYDHYVDHVIYAILANEWP